MANLINVTEYFGHICSRLNFKQTSFAYKIIAITTTCSSLQYCSQQQTQKSLEKYLQ